MTDNVVRQTSVPANSEGNAASLRLNRRGEVVGMPWYTSLVIEDKVFAANVGTETTPVSTNVNLVADQDQPEVLLRVPSGTTAIPLLFSVHRQVTGAVLSETVVTMCSNDVGNSTSDATTLGPISLLAGGATSSRCTPRQIVTANVSTPTNPVELYRGGENADIDAAVGSPYQVEEWSIAKGYVMPVLQGPASLLIAATCGISSSLFAVLIWAEFITGELV